MRFLKRVLLATVVAAATAGSAACDNTTAPAIDWDLQVAVTGGSNTPSVGDQVQFGAFIVSSSGGNITGDAVNVTELANWSYIGLPGVVTVSPTGLVTTLAPGGVAIQATYAGKTSNMSLLVE